MRKVYTLKVNYFCLGREFLSYEWYKSEALNNPWYKSKMIFLDVE